MKVTCEVKTKASRANANNESNEDWSEFSSYISDVLEAAESTCRAREHCGSCVIANSANICGVNPITKNAVFGKLVVDDDLMEIAIFVATAVSATGVGRYSNFKKVEVFPVSEVDAIADMIKNYALVDVNVDDLTRNLIIDAIGA
jgi:hypothetical protein